MINLKKTAYSIISLVGGVLSSAVFTFNAFSTGKKLSTIILGHVHSEHLKAGMSIGIGTTFALCNLVTNAILGKAGSGAFFEECKIQLSEDNKNKLLFVLKALLACAANIPSVYLTYTTLSRSENISDKFREPLAITAAALNCVFYTMLNTSGINSKTLIKFFKDKDLNHLTKALIFTFLVPASIITAIPSGLNGKNFINEYILKNAILANSFAALSLAVNGAFLANANLPIYWNLAKSAQNIYRVRNDDNSETKFSFSCSSITTLLGLALFSVFSSSAAPSIFRSTLERDTDNKGLLEAGEYISWGIISVVYFHYFHQALTSFRLDKENDESTRLLNSENQNFTQTFPQNQQDDLERGESPIHSSGSSSSLSTSKSDESQEEEIVVEIVDTPRKTPLRKRHESVFNSANPRSLDYSNPSPESSP